MDTENTGTTIDNEGTSTDTSVSSSPDVSQTSTPTPDTSSASADTKPRFKTTRDAARDAFDQIEAKNKEPVEPTTGGRKLPTGKTPPAAQASAAAAVPQDNAEDFDPISGQKLEPIKAPAGMPPALRETWSKLPREHQQFWAKREQDMSQNFTRLGANDKFAKTIQESAKALLPMLKANNTTLEAFTQRVYANAHQIANGTPQQKAVLLGNMIRQYKPDAATLKAVLAGQQVNVPQQRQAVNIEQEVQKRIEAERTKEREGTFVQAIQEFNNDPAHEFANDVGDAMTAAIQGGLVETEGKSAKEILKAAYDFAVANHPQIKQVLAARGAQPAAVPAQGAVPNTGARAVRSAKPSAGGGHTSGVPKNKFKTTRDAASAAYDQIFGGK
jgi:hypothetical protein